MKNRITTATKSIVASSNRLVPPGLAGGDITPRRTPAAAHGRWRLWSTHSLQKQFPFLPVDFTEKHSFLRALPMARPVPSPNCPLTAVCKLTSGTRPRDARSLLRRDLAADGRGKLSHSEVHRFILSRRPCPGSARHRLWLACGSHVVSDVLRGGGPGGGAPRGGGPRACAGGGGGAPRRAREARAPPQGRYF